MTGGRARKLLAELDALARVVERAKRLDLLTPQGRTDFALALESLDHQVVYLTYLLGQKNDEEP